MSEDQSDTINLLILSDIHRFRALHSLERRKDAILESFQPTYLVNCGDMIFIDYSGFQTKEELQSQEHLFKAVISHLESYNCPHLFVPGNHDHPSVYSNDQPCVLPELTEKTTNMHNRCVKIADHLWIIGFGGSTPRYTLDGQLSKPGYPYVDRDMESDTIFKLLDLIPEEDQVILMTHCPPDNVGSGFVFRDKYSDRVYKLGSPSLCNQIVEAQKTHKLFLNIHGHVHPEPGMNWIHSGFDDCCVVNPGSASSGKYAKLRLKRIDDIWRIVSFENCFSYE